MPAPTQISQAQTTPAGTSPARKPLHRIVFGSGGNDANHLGIGWSGDEAGHRWTLDTVSEIWLDHPGPGDLRVELDLWPLLAPPTLTEQRLIIRVRDTVVARSRLTSERPYAFAIPAALLATPGPVRIELEHPGARAPAEFEGGDWRKLALCVRSLTLYAAEMDSEDAGPPNIITIAEAERVTGLSTADFIVHFENLGADCEFGFVQRRCGAEPLGLLRFAFLSPANLLRALQTRFHGMGTFDNLEHFQVEGEYIIRDTAWELDYHTWHRYGTVDEQTLLSRQADRLAFLVRRLVRQLTDASKIFVWKSTAATAQAHAALLHAALDTYAPNTLLWATLADADHPPGSVEQIAPGLLRASMASFAPAADANDLVLEQWLEVCVKAWREVSA